MKQTINIFLGFVFIMVVGYFMIGFTDSVPDPTAGTPEYNQSQNLSKVTGVASAGVNGTILVLIGAMVLSGVVFFMHSFKKRR